MTFRRVAVVGPSTRPKDLVDILVIESAQPIDARRLREA